MQMDAKHVKNIVIIGGGIAGVTAAEAARNVSSDARIVIVNNEPDMPYMRMNLTRLIAGEVGPDTLELNKPEWYASNRIEVIHGAAEKIIPHDRTVILSDGKTLKYDSLVLANGSAPFVPPIPGVELERVFSLRTLVQARQILDAVKPGVRCACIGGGLLGIELAAGLCRRGADVTVLEGFGWLLPRQLAPPAATFLRTKIEAQGIKFRCGVKVSRMAGEDSVSGVELEGGEAIAADMVFLSTGVRSNTGLAEQYGLEAGRGVKVDDSMRTSDPCIFAAGDVAEHLGVVHGLWAPAMEQGRVAGMNAAGGSEIYKPMPPSAFLKVVGVDMFSAGQFMPEEGVMIFEQEDENSYARLAIKDNNLVGANLLGDIKPAILVKNMIHKSEPVRQNQRLVKYYPALEGFLSDSKE